MALPGWRDLLAILLLLGVAILLGSAARQALGPFALSHAPQISLSPGALPGYALRTVLRMLVALLASTLFTFTYATLAAKSRRAEMVLIPLLDVLQSVPVLGYLSFTVVFFVSLFPGSQLGPELAAIFAIFTSQAWNMAFSFYQSLRMVPTELDEASRSCRSSAWQRFWRLEVPFAMPGLVWNAMMSMAGGWFFVVASEAIAVGDFQVALPGVGSYVARAIQERDLVAVGWAIIAMTVAILLCDQLLFRPLVAWADKFRFHGGVGIVADVRAPPAWQCSLRMRSSWRLLSAVFAITVACGCTGAPPGLAGARVAPGRSASLIESPEAAAAPATRDFASSIARQRAAVVRVVAIRPSADLDAGADEEARIQLSRQLNPDSPTAPLPRTALRVEASGIVMTSDGYILTNAHVVEEACIVNVALITGKEYSARLVGTDLETDVAVLKIEAGNLPVAAIGDSQHLRAGQWVAAIGAPFGFEQSVAVGVVSALARHLPGESYTPFIQTDLNLNPGDSGGPLIDIEGNVVGINAEVAVSDGASTGISFALPIELVERIAAELIRSGRIDRAELGIGFQDVDPHLSAAFGAPGTAGALIHTVVAAGPAAKAGLKVGDIIVAFDGKSIAGAGQLADAIASLRPGSTIPASFWRGSDRLETLIHSGHSLTSQAQLSPVAARPVGSARELVVVHRLQPEARQLLRTEGYLIVMAVSERAAAAGLTVGDIVLAINTRPVRTRDELLRGLAKSQGALAFLIDRNGLRMFIAVPVAEPWGASRSASAEAGATR